LKKVFQSRWSAVCVLAVEVSWGGGVLIEDAWRMEIIDVEGLNTTLRFAFERGTRRLGWEEESVGRIEVGDVVWYAQGERRVGWSRQPIAAVRRVGAAPSMLNSFWVFVGGERGDLMLMSLAWEFGASSFEALEAAIGQSGFCEAKSTSTSLIHFTYMNIYLKTSFVVFFFFLYN
jgi:hypothetical protein